MSVHVPPEPDESPHHAGSEQSHHPLTPSPLPHHHHSILTTPQLSPRHRRRRPLPRHHSKGEHRSLLPTGPRSSWDSHARLETRSAWATGGITSKYQQDTNETATRQREFPGRNATRGSGIWPISISREPPPGTRDQGPRTKNASRRGRPGMPAGVGHLMGPHVKRELAPR